MKLSRTENSEIMFIYTEDLEVTIKGGASGDLPPLVASGQMKSGVVFHPRLVTKRIINTILIPSAGRLGILPLHFWIFR